MHRTHGINGSAAKGAWALYQLMITVYRAQDRTIPYAYVLFLRGG